MSTLDRIPHTVTVTRLYKLVYMVKSPDNDLDSNLEELDQMYGLACTNVLSGDSIKLCVTR